MVVCSSSRGGSSLFGELLRQSPDLLTFSAEINPHVTIPVLGAGPDLVADPTPACLAGQGRSIVERELILDLGRSAPVTDDADIAALADHTAWRLTMQWPQEEVDPARVHTWTRAALHALEDQGAWKPGSVVPREELLLSLLPRAVREHPGIDARRYDLPRRAGGAPPAGPHAPVLVEMAPFVLPRSWQRATVQQLRSMPVVVTTPRNASRLPLLRALFPNARMRVLHLTRNPAAAVNGLRDGWLHHGFFTVDTGEPMHIAGYSDRHPAWGSWWCYDLPPTWREWTDRPLPEVCGFQWRSAHAETVATSAQMGLERMQVRFEDVVGSRTTAKAALAEVAAWIGVDPAPLVAAGTSDLPVVMSTAAPRPGRWRANAALLRPVLDHEETVEQAVALGYGADPDGWV